MSTLSQRKTLSMVHLGFTAAVFVVSFALSASVVFAGGMAGSGVNNKTTYTDDSGFAAACGTPTTSAFGIKTLDQTQVTSAACVSFCANTVVQSYNYYSCTTQKQQCTKGDADCVCTSSGRGGLSCKKDVQQCKLIQTAQKSPSNICRDNGVYWPTTDLSSIAQNIKTAFFTIGNICDGGECGINNNSGDKDKLFASLLSGDAAALKNDPKSGSVNYLCKTVGGAYTTPVGFAAGQKTSTRVCYYVGVGNNQSGKQANAGWSCDPSCDSCTGRIATVMCAQPAAVAPAPTVSIGANPSSVEPGGSSQLTWTSTDADSCTGTGFDSGGAKSGTAQVSPTATTNYGISCTGSGGTAKNSTTVTVLTPDASLVATPSSIAPGGTSSLNWTATNVVAPGAQAVVQVVASAFTLTVPSSVNPNVFNLAKTAGWNGTDDLVIKIPAGVTVSSANTSLPALDTSSLPSGTNLTIVNRGSIIGAGGKGANTAAKIANGAPGFPGGPALKLTVSTTLDSSGGIISGGGGGGGAGAGCMNGECYDDPGGAGGGGAGVAPGPAGTAAQPQQVGPAAAGTTTAGGAGGKVCPSGDRSAECRQAANGGRGGDLGQPGADGAYSGYGSGGKGGAAGEAIVGTNYIKGASSKSVTHTSVCSIDNGVGPLTPLAGMLGGSQTVSPNTTTTYTMTCISDTGGLLVRTATVVVSGTAGPSGAAKVTANGSSSATVDEGDTATIAWSCPKGSTSSGSFPTKGAQSGTYVTDPLTADTTFTVSCSGGGQGGAKVTVLHPMLSISAAPAQVNKGKTTVLNWSASNVKSCTLTGPSTDTNFPLSCSSRSSCATPFSSPTGAITAPSLYTLSCSTSKGTVNKAITVKLIPSVQEI